MNENQLRAFAIYLHNKFCTDSHADDCIWYYETYGESDDNWEGHCHQDWFKKAEQVNTTYNRILAGK